jgi:hypothetical protein
VRIRKVGSCMDCLRTLSLYAVQRYIGKHFGRPWFNVPNK